MAEHKVIEARGTCAMAGVRRSRIAALGALLLLAAGCKFDERLTQLVGDASAPAPTPVLVPLDAGGASPLDPAVGVGPLEGAGAEPTAIDLGTPELSLNAEAFDWGPLPVGFAGTRALRLSNSGDGPMAPPGINLGSGSDPAFSIFLNRCTDALAPGASCEARLQFLPTVVGDNLADLAIDAGVAGGAALPLRGSGLSPGSLLLSPSTESSAEFGLIPVDSTLTQTFLVTNSGETASGVLEVFLNSGAYTLVADGTDDCVPGETDLAATQSCTIRVAFAPTARGRSDAELVVNAADSGAVALALSGEGLGVGELSASTESIDFRGVVRGQLGTAELLLENVGDLPLPLGAAEISGVNAEDFSLLQSTCGEALEAGTRCSLQVQFSPGEVGDRFASLLVGAGGVTHEYALTGVGLQPGSLVLAPAAPAVTDFADVLVNDSRVQVFTLQNPGAQPSGALTSIAAGGDFTPLAPSQPTDCQAGITSLVDGQSCTISVSFRPTQRGARRASLTVVSPLTGITGIELTGRGVLPPKIEALTEVVDFGDVVRGQTGSSNITVTNTGDQALAVPVLSIEGEAAASFVATSACTAALPPTARCEVTVTYRPVDSLRHSATLQLDGGSGGVTTVALRGRGVEPGSLVLAPAANNSAAFGDVNLNAEKVQTFSVSNPGGVASGPISVSISNNDGSVTFSRVAPSGADCTDTSSLVDGQSCTVRVRFAPRTNVTFGAVLRASSPRAGIANLNLSGRGVRAALLSQSESRDFGDRALGDGSRAAEFTRSWTVTNTGDITSAALTATSTNPGEFVVATNACAGVTLAARATCTVSLEFRPAAVGRREGTLTIAAGATQVVLSMTGDGFQRSGPGGTCTTATDCTGGTNASACGNGANGTRICCESACQGTCEFCNTQGQCVALSGGERCNANDTRRGCFGRNRCLLPDGQGCSGNNANCESGNCETSAGGGATVCCGEDCALGEECSANFATCQATLGDPGDACGSNADCRGGLTCGQNLDGAGGRCCNSACGGPCQGCNAAGTCVPRPPATTVCGDVGQVCLSGTLCDYPACQMGSVLGQCRLNN